MCAVLTLRTHSKCGAVAQTTPHSPHTQTQEDTHECATHSHGAAYHDNVLLLIPLHINQTPSS